MASIRLHRTSHLNESASTARAWDSADSLWQSEHAGRHGLQWVKHYSIGTHRKPHNVRFALKTTEFLHRREMSRRAKNGLMHRSNHDRIG